MSDIENVVEARQLEKRYGAVKALGSLDLELRSGSAVALVGRNGSGKSTLLRLLMGFFRPTSGSARVLGHDPTRLPEMVRAQIGYVADGQDLPTGMVVADYFNYLRPFYPTWDREFEIKLIGLLQVQLNRKLRHLSRGQRMKAAIVGALAFHPRLLILDEPFSGLDPAVRDEVMDALFETMRSQEWTMVISSHEIEEVERLADEVMVLDDGKALVREDKDVLLGTRDGDDLGIFGKAGNISAAGVFELRDRRLTIATQPHTSDFNPTHWDNAPRALQEIKGDFSFEVTIDPPSQGKGWTCPNLMIADSEKRIYCRAGPIFDGSRTYFNAFLKVSTQSSYMPWIGGNFDHARPLRVRLKREGVKFTVATKEEGREWLECAPFLVPGCPETLQVGVLSLNVSDQMATAGFEDPVLCVGDGN